MVAGSGLVVCGTELVFTGICWCRKAVAGQGLVTTGAELAIQLLFCEVFFLEYFHKITEHSSLVSL